MISHFELKNRPCCRLYHKIPYFIKNIILLSLLALILGINYMANQRRDAVSIQNVYKLIAGLNSQTFNFLSSNAEALYITSTLKSISVSRVTSVDFYSSCVGMSRPCLLAGMAKTWPAFNKWQYHKAGNSYLSKKIGDSFVTVFKEENPHIDSSDLYQGYSFNKNDVYDVAYSPNFLQ